MTETINSELVLQLLDWETPDLFALLDRDFNSQMREPLDTETMTITYRPDRKISALYIRNERTNTIRHLDFEIVLKAGDTLVVNFIVEDPRA